MGKSKRKRSRRERPRMEAVDPEAVEPLEEDGTFPTENLFNPQGSMSSSSTGRDGGSSTVPDPLAPDLSEANRIVLSTPYACTFLLFKENRMLMIPLRTEESL